MSYSSRIAKGIRYVRPLPKETMNKILSGGDKMSEEVRLIPEVSGHRLVIESLRDGKAYCSCGGWYFSQTGQTYVEDIFAEFEKHAELKHAPVYKNEREEV